MLKEIPMALRDKWNTLKNYRSSTKVEIDRYLDPALFLTVTNAAGLYGLDAALNWVSEHADRHEGLAMMGTYALLGTAIYQTNKHFLVPIAKKIKEYHENRCLRGQDATALSWVKSGGSLATLATLYVVTGFGLTLNDFRWDGDRVIDAFARNRKVEQVIAEEQATDVTPISLEDKVTLAEPALPQTSSQPEKNRIEMETPQEIRDTNKYSTKGRYLRAHRWDSIVRNVEKKYQLEEGILTGLIMRESFGNPLELNSGDDGGAGLMMFQPGTAQAYNLKVLDDAGAVGKDRNHGRKLRKLVKDNNYDYDVLASIDERFDVLKSTDAAGRYLRELYDKYGDWNKALSAYNRGHPADHPENTKHVKMVREFQRHYLEEMVDAGKPVDQKVLTKLQQEKVPEYHFVRKNEKDQMVYMYRVSSGDNATVISAGFNRWAKAHKQGYQSVDYGDVVDRDRKYIGNSLHPGQYVYVLAEPVHKSKKK